MRVAELANRLGCYASGDVNQEIAGVAYAASAKTNDVALVFRPKDAERTVSCILAMEAPGIIGDMRTIIYATGNMEETAVRIAMILMAEGICRDYSRQGTVRKRKGGFFAGENARIGANAKISCGAVIYDGATIGDNCRIGANTVVHAGVTIGDDVAIGSNSCIGSDAFYRVDNSERGLFHGIGGVLIGNSVTIGNQVTIQRGTFSDTIVKDYTRIANLIDIAHDVMIGRRCFIVSQTGIAGNAVIGNDVTLYGQVGVSNNVHVGEGGIVHAQSLVTSDICDYQEVSGYFAFSHKDELRLLAEQRRCLTKKENE